MQVQYKVSAYLTLPLPCHYLAFPCNYLTLTSLTLPLLYLAIALPYIAVTLPCPYLTLSYLPLPLPCNYFTLPYLALPYHALPCFIWNYLPFCFPDGPEENSSKLLSIPFVEDPQHRLKWTAYLEFTHNNEVEDLTWDRVSVTCQSCNHKCAFFSGEIIRGAPGLTMTDNDNQTEWSFTGL